MRLSLKVICALLVTAIMLSPSTMADWPPETWTEEDAKEHLNGHTFKEELWTTDISNTSTDGVKYTFTASYVNDQNVQAFLIAFNKFESKLLQSFILGLELPN